MIFNHRAILQKYQPHVLMSIGYSLPFLIFLFLSILCFHVRSVCAQELQDDQVKAALIFNFAKFVQWPTNSVTSGDRIFVFGVLGSEAVRDELERIVAERTIGGRRASVKYFRNVSELEPVHVMFIGNSAERELLPTMKLLKRLSVLTVGDSEEFLDVGGMVKFILRSGKIRFEMNLGAAENARLNISSDLVSLADTLVP